MSTEQLLLTVLTITHVGALLLGAVAAAVQILVMLTAAGSSAGAADPGATSSLRVRSIWTASAWVFAGAFLVNTAIIVQRWIEAGRAPFKTLYETMILYPWCIGVVTLVLIALYGLRLLVPFASAACLIGLFYAAAKPDPQIANLPPALQSVWFIPHVVTYFVAYAALFISAVLAGLALVMPNWRSKESGAGMEVYSHRSVMFGFSALTLGLLMGAFWATEAWGDYWSWDVKENWSLITWLAYLVYLHLRVIKGWRGRAAMVICLASFAAVVFTYLGMSMLPAAEKSDHVYQ